MAKTKEVLTMAQVQQELQEIEQSIMSAHEIGQMVEFTIEGPEGDPLARKITPQIRQAMAELQEKLTTRKSALMQAMTAATVKL